MIKQTAGKTIITAFAGVMFFGSIAFAPNKSDAAKKVSITKKVQVYEGKTVKVKLSNNKKKVTWSVTKGSKNISLSNKGKTGVTVKGRTEGTASVQAKIGNQKYVCSVTVKKTAIDADAQKGILTKSNLSYWGVKNSGDIVIPEGVKEIDQLTFNQKNITGVKFPSSLEKIGDFAFAETALETVEIPDSVGELGEGVFMMDSVLKSVKLSSGLKSMGEGLFLYCSELTDVTIPNGVTYIPNSCFGQCENLKSIAIPDSVTKIGELSFAKSGITNIEISDSVNEISGNSFNSDTKVSWNGTTYDNYDTFFDAFKNQG